MSPRFDTNLSWPCVDLLCVLCCCCFALQEAHETGVAMVVACAQDKAESYVESMRLNGLIASMEPGH